jgi:chromosome condensin MukBEF ATPase and DNA-binding subunit MukB
MEYDSFESFARGGLARLGIKVDDVEIEILRAVERVYGPPRDALIAADLSGIQPENDLDPSRAPSGPR